VYDLVRADVERVNHNLQKTACVRRFVLLHKEFDPDEAELTRTRKLRRRTLHEHYREIINALYGDEREVNVRAAVRYRDGREGVIETTVHVETLEEEGSPT
jgi:long-chain acyl-CoA synthetase